MAEVEYSPGRYARFTVRPGLGEGTHAVSLFKSLGYVVLHYLMYSSSSLIS